MVSRVHFLQRPRSSHVRSTEPVNTLADAKDTFSLFDMYRSLTSAINGDRCETAVVDFCTGLPDSLRTRRLSLRRK